MNLKRIGDTWQIFRLSDIAFIAIPGDSEPEARQELAKYRVSKEVRAHHASFTVDAAKYRCRLRRIKGFVANDGGHLPYLIVDSSAAV